MCFYNRKYLEKKKQLWLELNPEYNVRVYDNTDCEQFLQDNFSKEHADIFRFIPSGPIKADFWRVCILYIYGGIYADVDIEPIKPLSFFIDNDIDFLTVSTTTEWSGLHGKQVFNPHLIVAKKEDEILLECISRYLDFYRRQIPFNYCSWSIVTFLSTILDRKGLKLNNTHDYIIDGKRIRILFEIPESIIKARCIYNGTICLWNRDMDYINKTWMSRKTINSEKIKLFKKHYKYSY